MAKQTLNKTDLIQAIADQNRGLTKQAVSNVVDSFFTVISQQVSRGNEINVTGFGKFYMTERAARMGRNPATGASIKIAAKRSPKFTAGKAFRDAVAK